MKVLVVVDGHLGRTPDGKIWSSRIYNYDFFARYLLGFDEVRVAMRIHDIKDNRDYPNLCSGPNVEFYPVEEFKGPKEYALKYFKIRRSISSFFEGCDCAIFRIPSTIGYQFWKEYRKQQKPYAVEVVVDPWDFAAPGTLKTPLRPIIRYSWTNNLKKACLEANGVSYVTKFALQERYPSTARLNGETENYFEEYYSSVNIPLDYYAEPRSYSGDKVYTIIHVTNYIGNHVKGHEELIAAISNLKKQGITVNGRFVAEGNLIGEFTEYAKSLDVKDQVVFSGKLSSGSEVREALLNADLFVFPSHAEGLPRVLIEAMATGLPCISTNVNGIPELLDKDRLIEVGDIQSLTDMIKELILSPDKMEQDSQRNIERAKQYSDTVLQMRRKSFYQKLCNLTAKGNEGHE